MTNLTKNVADMTALEVQNDRNWPSHMTTDEMRKQLRHEEACISPVWTAETARRRIGGTFGS